MRGRSALALCACGIGDVLWPSRSVERLFQPARLDGHCAPHEHLFGVDLILRIEEDGDVAQGAARWISEEGEGRIGPGQRLG